MSNNDLISRNELCAGRVSNDPVVIAAKCAPAVDAEPVRYGTWKPYYTPNGAKEFGCSACKKYHFHNGALTRGYKFCPVCGARMDGGVDNAHTKADM